MLPDVKYFNYPEGKKYTSYFFDGMFCWNIQQVPQILDQFKKLKGISIAEDVACSFAVEARSNDLHYFGESGVAIYVDYPVADENVAVILTYQQFLEILRTYIIKYKDEFSPDKFSEIQQLYDSLRNVLLSIDC